MKRVVHVRNGESEGGEGMRSFGRSRLGRREELKPLDEGAKVFSDSLLQLPSHYQNSGQTQTQ